MRSQSPAESCHVMDDADLRAANAQVLGVGEDGILLGIVALTQLDPHHGEIKSMHTVEAARGRGVGRRLLRHLIDLARAEGFRRLSLETGSAESFAAARTLYLSEGFVVTQPFAGYVNDPLSVYMTREI
ncbi:GNAT family N-acetyltransferase [Aestuariivita boseongensis]|uniref:GNAT family N-acetyltransferase n=1 Tax=Aestuariivita boseongensis TaxID=1470562 RepID=UPI0009E1A3F4|nr:GNAT family N-acetyltransferase [Aestuariivita boseongensis]